MFEQPNGGHSSWRVSESFSIHKYTFVVTLEQKKLQIRQHALEMPEGTIQNMGTHGSITGKTMTRIICFDHNNCYYSSSELVTDEEDEL